MKIRLVKPYVGKEELENIREVFERAWLGNGPKVVEFEKAWSEYLGCRDSVAVNSCTAALHLALWVYQFPKGKKVLVPAIFFTIYSNIWITRIVQLKHCASLFDVHFKPTVLTASGRISFARQLPTF